MFTKFKHHMVILNRCSMYDPNTFYLRYSLKVGVLNYWNPTIHTGNHFDGSDVFQNFRGVSGLFRLEHTLELDFMYTHGLSEIKAQCPELSTHSALLLVFVRVCQIRKRVLPQPIYLELALSSHSSFFFVAREATKRNGTRDGNLFFTKLNLNKSHPDQGRPCQS